MAGMLYRVQYRVSVSSRHSLYLLVLLLLDISMKDFTMGENNITYIPDDAFFGLTFYGASLYLGNNPIRSISKNAFRGIVGRITRVDLSDCRLTEFPEKALNHLPYLSILRLQNNQLTEIPDGAFNFFLNLNTLSLGGNTIKNINRHELFSGVEDVLENVELNSMKIHSFPSKTLMNLKRLQRIDLSNNTITTLPGNMFKGFQTQLKLQVLLGRNNMTSISPHLFRESHIRLCRLNLIDNQLTTLDFIDVCSPVYECEHTDDIYIHPSILLAQNPLRCECGIINHLRPDALHIVGTCDQSTIYQEWNLYRPLSQNDIFRNFSEECPNFDPNICSSGLESSVTLWTMMPCLLILSCTYINL